MKQQPFTILLGVLCVVLAVGYYKAHGRANRLAQQLAILEEARQDQGPREEPAENVSTGPVTSPAPPEPPTTVLAAPRPPDEIALRDREDDPEDNRKRMMRSLSKMMSNRTMNKVMEATQRSALGVLYEDLTTYLELNNEESSYFFDLLMLRQMKNVELGMTMMSGELDEEEKRSLMEEVKEAAETVREEMKQFLNNADDFAEWEFYEKTMGERMMLSQVDDKLTGTEAELSHETYRELLQVMYEEKTKFPFRTNLHDNESTDVSSQRFSKTNLQHHGEDMERLNAAVAGRVRVLLSPEQYNAFMEGLKDASEMQQVQLDMVARMFGGDGE